MTCFVRKCWISSADITAIMASEDKSAAAEDNT